MVLFDLCSPRSSKPIFDIAIENSRRMFSCSRFPTLELEAEHIRYTFLYVHYTFLIFTNFFKNSDVITDLSSFAFKQAASATDILITLC